MLSAFLETIGTLGMLASIVAKIAAINQLRKKGAETRQSALNREPGAAKSHSGLR